jgi:hypothetical protein
MDDKDYYLSMANRPQRKDKFSQYRGVAKSNGNYLYRVQLKYKGVLHNCGSFNDEIEAALAYNRRALQIIGPHAVLNDVSKGPTPRPGNNDHGTETNALQSPEAA